MTSCQCEGVEQIFDNKTAMRKLRDYQRKGPAKTTRLLLDGVRAAGGGSVEDATLLNIGGGEGAIQLELLSQGLRSATDVDASGAYLAVAREEARRRGYDDRVTYHYGNFVELADEIESADFVTLDRVICCFDDMPALVGASVARARRVYGLVYPRDDWWVRAGRVAENTLMWLQRNPFRSYVHPTHEVDAIVRGAGMKQYSMQRGAIWQVVVYARP